MGNTFWAGLIGAVVGSGLGVVLKQRGAPQERGVLFAAGIAIVVFVILTAVFALV